MYPRPGEPGREKLFRQWLATVIGHVKKRGLGYENFSFLWHDEPSQKAMREIVMPSTRVLRSVDPKAQIWIDISSDNTAESITKSGGAADIWCPSSENLKWSFWKGKRTWFLRLSERQGEVADRPLPAQTLGRGQTRCHGERVLDLYGQFQLVGRLRWVTDLFGRLRRPDRCDLEQTLGGLPRGRGGLRTLPHADAGYLGQGGEWKTIGDGPCRQNDARKMDPTCFSRTVTTRQSPSRRTMNF